MSEPKRVRALVEIELSKIQPSKKNPRGPNVRENDPHRDNLRDSIGEFGILVPLIVRPLNGEYELIDGERRYWIASSMKLERVPAYLIKDDLDEKEIVRQMFQIHMNRDQWGPVQQCKAFEVFYSELVTEYAADADALIKEYATFTGDDVRTAKDRIQFLRWPKKIKETIYADPKKHSSYWYVVEIEDKIVEPALRNYPEYFAKVDPDIVREFLYQKWEENTVKAAVDPRHAAVIVRKPMKEKKARRKVLRILDKLIRETDFSYEDAYKEFAQQFPNLIEPELPKPRALLNSIRRLTDVLSEYEPAYFRTYKRAPSLKEISTAVERLLVAGSRFLQRGKE